eukprot:gene769-biopygen12009
MCADRSDSGPEADESAYLRFHDVPVMGLLRGQRECREELAGGRGDAEQGSEDVVKGTIPHECPNPEQSPSALNGAASPSTRLQPRAKSHTGRQTTRNLTAAHSGAHPEAARSGAGRRQGSPQWHMAPADASLSGEPHPKEMFIRT